MKEEKIHELIKLLTKNSVNADVFVGIGDDSAVINSGNGRICITTDLLIEGVHFDMEYTSPYELGLKAIAVSLSDIAAMGANPKWAVLSLGLPLSPSFTLVSDFFKGILNICEEYGVVLVGGDTVRSSKITVNVCLLGEVEKETSLLRSGIKSGDLIFVTGFLGSSAAGLSCLTTEGIEFDKSNFFKIIDAHLCPKPRVKIGKVFARSGLCRAMMDISDGLVKDLGRLCNLNKMGAYIEQEKIPLHEESSFLANILKKQALEWALMGGEDFELLVVCSPQNKEVLIKTIEKAQPKLLFSQIGEFFNGNGVFLRQQDGIEKELFFTGFEHF